MNCPTDDVLRAYLDAELDPPQISELKSHLQSCSACEGRFQALSASALRVASKLSSLDAPPSLSEMNPDIALARFKAGLPAPETSEEHLPFLSRVFGRRWRFAWATSFAVAVLAISLMFPATRGFAQRLLATLRVERVQTVSLDFTAMNTETSSQPLEMLAKMLSDNAVITTNERETTADSQSAASQAAGFPVRVLSGRSDEPSFDISGAHAFHLTLDRPRLQDLLDQAGRPDLLLPATLDGATVSVQVPRAVAVAYGNCRKGHSSSTAQAPSTAPNPCLLVMQAPSPVINVPSDLNIQQLAEIGLQLAGWNPVKAREFCQTVDWKSTLVLPIPRTVQSYETVSINGVRGTLLHFPDSNSKRPSFALIWVDNGIIYSIIGNADPSSAVELASSLE
jgi:putative zinc finger protein